MFELNKKYISETNNIIECIAENKGTEISILQIVSSTSTSFEVGKLVSLSNSKQAWKNYSWKEYKEPVIGSVSAKVVTYSFRDCKEVHMMTAGDFLLEIWQEDPNINILNVQEVSWTGELPKWEKQTT